jgi:glycosyltransferase involved in cell wall biosynthesis
MKRLVFDIRDSCSDIIYIEHFRDIFFVLLSFILLNTNRVVQAIHDVIPHSKTSNITIISFLDKLIFNKYKYFHFFSETQAEFFQSKYPNKKYFVGPLMLKNFGPRQDVNLSEEPIEFLFFGVISYYKGLDNLINAIEKLINIGFDNIKLTIAGKGDFWYACKELISKKNITFYDLKIKFIQNSQIPLIFSKTHYLVLPYRDVTQSGVLFTSYFYNIPIVAPNFNEFETYIDDKINGFLYDKSDNDGLFNTLKYTIENHDKYDFIKSNLKNLVDSKFNNNVIAEKYYNFFKSISNEK